MLDAKAENRPTARELYQILKKWKLGEYEDSEIIFKIKEYMTKSN